MDTPKPATTPETADRPLLVTAVMLIWEQKWFVAAGIIVIAGLAGLIALAAPRTYLAKGLYQISRPVKDFMPESGVRENRVVNTQTLSPGLPGDAKRPELANMQNVQDVTIFQPTGKKVQNLSWLDPNTEFFITYDVFARLQRSLGSPEAIEAFLAAQEKKYEGIPPSQIAAAVKNAKPVYAYTEERKIPSQSYRDAVNYVLGLDMASSAGSPEAARSVAEAAGAYLTDRLLYLNLRFFLENEDRRLGAEVLDSQIKAQALAHKLTSLERERDELAAWAARSGAAKGEPASQAAATDGKPVPLGPTARLYATQTALLETRQQAESLAFDMKSSALALDLFANLAAQASKPQTGASLLAFTKQQAKIFTEKSVGNPAALPVVNRLGILLLNLAYYGETTLGFHDTLAAEPPASRLGPVLAAVAAGLMLMLWLAYLRQSFREFAAARRENGK